MADYDAVIIGGGPGGYVCAIKAAQLRLNVACVEKRKFLGGTCLNVGCIPSKALLHSSYLYYEAVNHFVDHGINIGMPEIDVKKMMSRKDKVVSDLAKGIDCLFEANGITKITGYASIKSANEVEVKSDGGNSIISTKNIVIATGSETMSLPGVEIDEDVILSSTGALELTEIPKKMAIIGGGVIGVEMASIWSRLGCFVTVIEYGDRIIPAMDEDVGSLLLRLLGKQEIKFKLSTEVSSVERKSKKAIVKYGDNEELEVDKVLVSIGRKPNTDNLGIEIEKDKRGFIKVDKNFATNIPGVFAIGDSTPGMMLAHKAEEEGVAVAEILAGKHGHVGLIPSVVYTHPEVAGVGYTEQEIKNMGVKYKVGKFPFAANSRARAVGDTDGFVKIIVDGEDTILGAHIIGPKAGTLIGELAVAMEYGAASEDIARICHSHPDLNEAIKEAALAAHAKAIHNVS
ncbi:MAG: dihydrolipoyl dehydrogenase [Rickettsiaceae bacterium H1]|nr:dihydrolipoyl dehydrogenase [Rickettsiaceae bacterium H1]